MPNQYYPEYSGGFPFGSFGQYPPPTPMTPPAQKHGVIRVHGEESG